MTCDVADEHVCRISLCGYTVVVCDDSCILNKDRVGVPGIEAVGVECGVAGIVGCRVGVVVCERDATASPGEEGPKLWLQAGRLGN